MQQVLSKAELSRLNAISIHEKRLQKEGYSQIAGIDEAGRGPLAGPVVAAACILPFPYHFQSLNDSKQLSPEIREELYHAITSHPETRFGIGISSVETIDRFNILQATFFAMRQAIEELQTPPDYLLIDGNQAPRFDIPHLTIVEGDAHSVSIAAASILAKVTRDRMMAELDLKWPQYGFKKHKGYGTQEHLEALGKWGPCPLHRKSFEPVKSLIQDEQVSFLKPQY
jgi:ribonuclease HII